MRDELIALGIFFAFLLIVVWTIVYLSERDQKARFECLQIMSMEECEYVEGGR